MILCAGEALIDMIPSVAFVEREAFVPHVGGAVFNTAIALGRLKIPVGMLTALSKDKFGSMLMEALRQSNVDTRYIYRSKFPTTLAFLHIAEGNASYYFYDENSATRMFSLEDVPEISDEVHTLYVGGISLTHEPCGHTYATLVEQYANDKIIMLDPNIRTNFIKCEKTYKQRLIHIMQKTDILKVSEEDLNWLFPTLKALNEKIHALQEIKRALIIVTRGDKGAIGCCPNGEIVRVAAQEVEVKDTVGAGDTFNAGLLAKLLESVGVQKQKLHNLRGETLIKTMQFATKVAGITVSRSGANPPRIEEI